MSVPYLIGHYLYNLWGAPYQDNQSIVRPKRITPFGGTRNHVKLVTEDYNLPTKHERYHAYMVGQVSEEVFNFHYVDWHDRSHWFNMADHCVEHTVVFQFYTEKGITIPLSHIYYTLTREKNLVLIIKEDLKLDWDMNSEDILFRTYDNVLHHYDDQKLPKETIAIQYAKPYRSSDKNPLITFYNTYKDKPGRVFTYVNGYLVNDPITVEILEKDVVELIYDSTITKVIEMKVGSVPTFKSKIDQIRKYLFTHNLSYKENLFEYYDDCDFHLCAYPNSTPRLYKGVVLHRNSETNIRQVSNCDFSISTNLVKEMMDNHDFINEQIANVVFRVYYRKQYGKKTLPFVNNRLHELNKLDYENRLAAMQGMRSNIDEWRADVLEASALARLIVKPKAVCDITEVQEVYGYNAATYYTGKSLHPYETFIDDGLGGKLVNVPYAYRKYSTIFEYDEGGYLLSWRRLGDYNQYPVTSPDCRLVEFISGIGTRQPNDSINILDIEIPEDEEFRVYACIKGLEEEPNRWEDVTNEEGVWAWKTINGKRGITITGTSSRLLNDYTFTVRTDRTFLCRTILVPFTKGILSFTLNQHYYNVEKDNVFVRPARVPYGYLDIFLNGKALIEGVDYFVEFPQVYIINKSCLDLTKDNQEITYRMMSFAETRPNENGEGTRLAGITVNRQVGYVNNHMLSRNGVWEIFDDKNYLFKVGNGIIDQSKLGFSERGSLIPERVSELEGKPYEIRDIIVPKRLTYTEDTYSFKKKSDILDKKVSDYMGQFFKDKEFSTNPPIEGLYKVYSIILSRIIHDLKRKQYKFPNIESRYTDQEVIQFVESNYKSLFVAEPYFRLDNISMKHVTIHPTYKNEVTTLDYHEVRFLKQIVRIYFRNEIEISHFIRIGEGT